MIGKVGLTLKEYLSYLRHQDSLYFCLLLFLWYGNHPDFFERKLFLNEVLSLIGFLFFLSRPILFKENDYIYNIVIFILFVFLIYAGCSLFIFKSFYGYLRNTVIVYSMFSFFLGIQLYRKLAHIRFGDPVFLSALIPGSSFYRTGYAASLPIYSSTLFRSCNAFTLLLMFAVMLSVKFHYGGSTAIAVMLLIIVLQVLNRFTKYLLYIGMALLAIALFGFLKPYLDLLLAERAMKINDIEALNHLFNIDLNTTIRVFLWAYLIFEVFLNYPFGIGLGTVFFPHQYTWHKLNLFIYDPNLEFTLGAHNSFLTILVRFGIIGLIPFLILYLKLINDFIRDKNNRKNGKLLFFYYAFFIITGCAMVNVVLESPIHASVYWVTLGMLYQAKQDRSVEQ